MTRPSIPDYLSFLFRPFFRAWWAALTGFASVLALFLARESTVEVGGTIIALAVLLAFTILFVLLSVLTQGWALFQQGWVSLRVSSFDRSKELSEGWVLVIEASTELSVGTVLDVYRRSGLAEVPLALVRIVSRNSSGAFQATPIGKINPVHIREHANGGLRPGDLVVRPYLDLSRLREVSRDV